MDQETAVNRVIRDLKMMGILSEEGAAESRQLLNALYVSGWEARKKEYNQSQEKVVIQEDRNHKKVSAYPSMEMARKKIGMSKTGMIEAIKHSKLTRKGYYFRYAS